MENNFKSVGCFLLLKSLLCICGTETSLEKKNYNLTHSATTGHSTVGNMQGYLKLNEFFRQKFSLSTEDAAFSLKMMQKYDYTAQKMKFSIKDFFSKCDQIAIANMPFQTKINIYNYVFGYIKKLGK